MKVPLRGEAPAECQACKTLRSSGALRDGTRTGLQALPKADKKLVLDGDRAACSIDLDATRKPVEGQAPRWDYLIVDRQSSRGVALEIHPASPKEVDGMIKKKRWAQDLLRREAPSLGVNRWCWVVRSSVDLPKTGSAYRRLREANIEFPARAVRIEHR